MLREWIVSYYEFAAGFALGAVLTWQAIKRIVGFAPAAEKEAAESWFRETEQQHAETLRKTSWMVTDDDGYTD